MKASAWILARQSVEKRTELFAAAIRRGDVETVMGMSLPGTEGDALKWYAEIYKQYLDLKLALGGQDPGVKIQVQNNAVGESAQALVVFSREAGSRTGPILSDDLEAVPRNVTTKQSLEMVLFWTPDTWGTWRFDAKRTIEAGMPRP